MPEHNCVDKFERSNHIVRCKTAFVGLPVVPGAGEIVLAVEENLYHVTVETGKAGGE